MRTERQSTRLGMCKRRGRLTDVGRLDLDARLEVSSLRSFDFLVLEDRGIAQGVHKRGTTSPRGTCRVAPNYYLYKMSERAWIITYRRP